MMKPARSVFAVVAGLAIVVTGCANTDIEFNGGLFDAVGLSSIGKKREEPQVARRPGIVVPPTTAALPVPGSAPKQPKSAAASADPQAWPVDPEERKVQVKRVLQEKHQAFCEEAERRYRSGIDRSIAEGPLGSCEPSIVRNLTGKPVYSRPAGAPAQ